MIRLALNRAIFEIHIPVSDLEGVVEIELKAAAIRRCAVDRHLAMIIPKGLAECDALVLPKGCPSMTARLDGVVFARRRSLQQHRLRRITRCRGGEARP